MEEPVSPAFEHRFLVRTAEEAVRAIRERLGESAEVVSVRRETRAGLGRWFRPARLEVIARVSPAGQGLALPSLEAGSRPATPWDDPEEVGVAAPRSPSENSRLARLLLRLGFGGPLLARLQGDPHWGRIEHLDLPQALAETATLLRREHAGTPRPPLTGRIAFVGVAGAGGTSALCKHLAQAVFGQGQRASVYRLDTGRPNPIDGLAALCELWGVPLLRAPEELASVGEGTRLYVDVPGLCEGPGRGEEAKIAGELDKLAVGSRVFVLNAAYETAVLKGLCRRAEMIRCQHLGFTHLDELQQWGKMWEFLLHRHLSTEFYSVGPGLPGDFTTDVLEVTLEKTFS